MQDTKLSRHIARVLDQFNKPSNEEPHAARCNFEKKLSIGQPPPFAESRVGVCGKIKEFIQKEANLSKEKIRRKESHGIPAITACSSWGKTRQLLETRSIVSDLNQESKDFHFEFVLTTYGTGMDCDPQSEHGGTIQYFALRLVYSYYFPLDNCDHEWTAFANRFKENFEIKDLVLCDVLELIAADIRARQPQPFKKVFLVLGVDDFHLLNRNNGDKLFTFESHLIQTMLNPNLSFRIQPIFSGLFSEKLHRAMVQKPIVPIPLPPISNKDGIRIMENFTKDPERLKSYIGCYCYNFNMWVLGSVPKKLAIFAIRLDMDDIKTPRSKNLLMEATDYIDLLTATLFPTLMSSEIKSISFLESYGCIQILEQDPLNDQYALRICLPFTMMMDLESIIPKSELNRLWGDHPDENSYLYSTVYDFVFRNLPIFLSDGSFSFTNDWRIWRELGAYYLNLRLSLLHHAHNRCKYRQEFISLNHLLYGFKFLNSWDGDIMIRTDRKKRIVKINKEDILALSVSKNKYVSTHHIGEQIDWTSGEDIYINAGDELTAHVLTVFKDCMHPSQPNTTFDLIYFENRNFEGCYTLNNFLIYHDNYRQVLNQYRLQTQRNARMVFGSCSASYDIPARLLAKIMNSLNREEEGFFSIGRKDMLRHYPMFQSHSIFHKKKEDN